MRPLPKNQAIVASVVLIALTGALDFATGVEIRIFPLYFLPVALGGWFARGRWAFVLSVLSAASWTASNLLAGQRYSSPYIWAANFVTQLVAFAVVALLIAELHRRLDAERDLSRSDPLTSLPNSRAFYEHANLWLAQARRHGRPATMAYLDLDNFKAVNDRDGHEAGDGVLRAVAEVLRRHIRAGDLLARMGGDEFALLLPDTGADGARVLLDRLRAAVAEETARREWPVGVSVGAVTFVRPPATIAAAIGRADALMYAAKQAGKNRVQVEVAGPPAGEPGVSEPAP